jgi:hypothetical protein
MISAGETVFAPTFFFGFGSFYCCSKEVFLWKTESEEWRRIYPEGAAAAEEGKRKV